MRKVMGWILTITGCAYPVLLMAQGITWLSDKQPIHIHIPLLVGSIIVGSVGIWLKEERRKGVKKPKGSG